MAFRMNRPVINGSKLHKSSVAKAKADSIVSQARTQADGNLLEAGRELGESIIGGSIDYKLPKMDIDFSDREEKEDNGEEKQTRKKEKPVSRIKTKEIKSLPTSKKKEELKRSTNTVESKASRDRFVEAAEKANLPLKTVEDWERAERLLVYDDKLDDWREKGENIIVDRLLVGENANLDESNTSSTKNQFQEMTEAGRNYGLSGLDMKSDGKGGYVPKEGAVSQQYGETWGDMGDGTMGWLDSGEEQYYSPDGKKMTKEAAEKFGDERIKKAEEKKQRKLELEEKNKGIRERNQLLADFREANPNKRVTQPNIDAWLEEQREAEKEIEIYEENDPMPGDPDYNVMLHGSQEEKQDYQEQINRNSNTPKQKSTEEVLLPQPTNKVVAENKTSTIVTKPRMSDFRNKKNVFGGTLTAKDQYEKALRKYYKNEKTVSSMKKRDDRIFKNAIKGGVVQKEMLKQGYNNGI